MRLLHSHIQLGFDTSLCYVSGRSPLAAAAANGQTESVDFLIREGPFSLNEQDSRGLTPMSLAASRSQEHVVSAMLSMQPSKDLKVNLPDDHGRSALFWACSSNSGTVLTKCCKTDVLIQICWIVNNATPCHGLRRWSCRYRQALC